MNQIWNEKEKLGNTVNLTMQKIEHLLLYIFICFNFVTVNLAHLKIKGVDIVSFYPMSLDIFVIGCTTGILKDDLEKMDSALKEMESSLPDLFKYCSVTPVVVCSEIASISPLHMQYADQNKIRLIRRGDIDNFLEMLNNMRRQPFLGMFTRKGKKSSLPASIPGPPCS